MKLSIIIPAYNEEKTIQEIVRRVKAQPLPGHLQKEIILVNDGSRDKTGAHARKIPGIILFTHARNRGKGAAIRTGLAHATGELVIIQDADLELSPTDYPALLAPLLAGAPVVYGSRLLGKRISKHTLFYYAGGRLITLAANLIHGIHITDEPIGYKAFKTSVLRSLHLECERFEFCPEVTAKIARRHIPIVEVPVKYEPRSTAEGKKLNWKDGVQAIWILLKYRFTQ